jgi:L-iditol 2-dehydrogenase
MKAAIRDSSGVKVQDVTLRGLSPDEIRIKVDACGVCGTDLLTGGGGEEGMFGHEVSGTVLELGKAVTGLEIGQKIVLDSSTPCGVCENCKNCEQELCTDLKSFFINGTFGFAEEMIAPGISAVPYSGITPEIASLAEPLGVSIDMARLADIRPDSNVLLLGAGPIGLMALAIAKRQGARRLFVSELGHSTARIAAAKKYGADDVVDPTKIPLSEVDFGCKIDRVMVTTPPATLADAMAVAAKGGIISYIGIRWGDGAFCRFDANDFHFKKLQLRASFASPAMYTPRAVQYLREGVVDGNVMVSHTFKLDQISDALQMAKDSSKSVKVVVTP